MLATFRVEEECMMSTFAKEKKSEEDCMMEIFGKEKEIAEEVYIMATFDEDDKKKSEE